ncbi:hypothetical protein B0H16DRAFT_1464602 [Mycena metata]|uniref:Uncharacterized protein n=1 Tax=Mycena metata TaxID=1033252 RepID=A0AAD7IG54_9AGAR|nr:hypothetical protein B0H16DRAFT_1464602 [Mycena metata]
MLCLLTTTTVHSFSAVRQPGGYGEGTGVGSRQREGAFFGSFLFNQACSPPGAHELYPRLTNAVRADMCNTALRLPLPGNEECYEHHVRGSCRPAIRARQRAHSWPLLVFNDIYHGIGSLPFLVFIVTGSLTYAAYCIYQKYHIALHYARAALNNIWCSVQVPRSDVVSKNASPDRTCMRPPRSPPHPRLGNDLEDVGILSTSDPGPSSGSLLHLRDTVFTKAIPSSTISSVPIDPNSTHIPPVHPPINRNTLKELDLDVIIRNPPLCHDLLFDPGLQLRSSSAPRPRVKACPRRCFHDRHALQNVVEGVQIIPRRGGRT